MSMENKSTSSLLPTALRLCDTVTTDKSKIIEYFMKIFLRLALLSSWLPQPTALHP
jgi:hypothetical protein